MTRCYRLDVEGIGIGENEIRKVLVEEFGWEEISFDEMQGRVSFSGVGYLSGGQSEQEAHHEIYSTLRSLNPGCKARTRWTYLDDIPFEEYGDELV